jgi:uncharacterized protein YjbJ (UPF0337 family)
VGRPWFHTSDSLGSKGYAMGSKGNEAAGAIEYIKGKLQRTFGKHTGDRSVQTKGVVNQAKGGARYEVGKAEGALDNLTND